MARHIEFTVHGRPQQRGSKRAIPFRRKNGKLGVGVQDDNPNSRAWMEMVSSAASQAMEGELITGAVSLRVLFRFARPQSHYGTGRNAGTLKESAPLDHTQSPDLSKLIRAVEDALTGVVWRDDRQVVGYGTGTGKKWDSTSHAVVAITELEPTP